MNFEWFFSKKTIWKDCSKNRTLLTIVIITQITITFGLIIAILTFSIGFGFKEIIKEKLLNVRGQIIVKNKNSVFSIKNKNYFLKKYFNSNYIKQIHGIIENNVIIGTNNKTGRYIYKGLYEDYNPIFFQYFLVKGNFCNKKTNDDCHKNIILSKKISRSLGLNIGSNVKIDFLFFKKKGTPIIISKKFIVSGLYETGIPEFDDLYIIGNIKSIQQIYGWKKDLSEKFEIFGSSFQKINKKIFEKIPNNFSVKIIYDQQDHDITEWINIFDSNIIVISFIVFMSLVINMIVFILILILERIRTIGILKILGAQNKTINKIFLFYVLQIFIPSLIIGNIIGITLLMVQKKFHLVSLNKIQYFVDFVPIYINISHILIINLSITLICFVTMFFPTLFIVHKITPIKVVEFE
ncbi:lipoprotein releasing system transmembrane protein [Blattabacterium sp. (Blattella germanica) str. Bge]|uniref:ABC transporter permease n=1 Tax=Blattabacterium sp. (Blattella germanica) TaxID=624186 RepID=UPI0001BB60F0|nr:FtsX-like permease family protein [Blattabacterium sp. (Blattella germanica)]ACY40186.1 lipoprotein releasing system transmembrane protein [Blattabacterium sp. (Blattella germanica) str. Bge]